MIPLMLFQNLAEILHFLMLILRWRRIQQRRRANAEFSTLISLLSININFLSNYLNLLMLILRWIKLRKIKKRHLLKPHLLIHIFTGYRSQRIKQDMWDYLQQNWTYFFWLTGETPHSLQSIVDGIEQNLIPNIQRGRPQVIDFRNQILLTMIYLRRYSSMHQIAAHFGIPVTCTHRIIHKCIKLLHAYLVPKYIRWHPMQHWRNLAGTYPEWPHVVGILDCTPFRIRKPKGPMQRLFYRRDRHCCFLNWLVIVDVLGYVVLSRPGFIGRVHDSVCLRNVNLPVLPQGLQIIADQGFEHRHPIVVLPRANQQQVNPILRRAFRSRCSMIERVFGIIKNSYCSVSSYKFRNLRNISPIFCNLVAAIFNRRKLIFSKLRENSGYKYMT